MAALKHNQPADETRSPSIAQSTATSTSGTLHEDFATLYRHFSKNLPVNFSLQHGTGYVAVALQNGILDTLTNIGWRSREKQLFAERVAGITESDTFIAQASDEIGLPKKDETEDEFVERGKAVFRRLLGSTLNK